MAKIELTSVNSDILNKWVKDCLLFWNLFYSFLILNDLDVIINDLNIINSGDIIDLENFITFLTINSNDEVTINNIISKEQKFQINDIAYSAPQNFLGVQIKEDDNEIKIYFYYLGTKNEKFELVDIDTENVDNNYQLFFNLAPPSL